MDGRRRRRWPYSPAMVEGERGVGGGEVGGLAGRFVHFGHNRTLTERPRDSFRKRGKTGK